MPADNHLRYSDNYLREGCREPTHSPSATMTDDARQTVEALDPGLKPFLKPRSSPSFRQKQDSETKLAENDRIDGDFSFVSSQPFNDFRMRCRFGRLAENIGIDEVGHSASVDSASIDTKNPFSGHVSNQSTRPSFDPVLRRTSRYSPRSIRSISNS